ncbi:hypothetical protein IWX46DRAFT_186460 [Phyllosticta citricarpa]|uniref:Secreted protein n=1 Tax=Phyllosticta citricarpa TaxID=55181 RepID=A0ABR1M1K8_9PEZI
MLILEWSSVWGVLSCVWLRSRAKLDPTQASPTTTTREAPGQPLVAFRRRLPAHHRHMLPQCPCRVVRRPLRLLAAAAAAAAAPPRPLASRLWDLKK